MKYAEIKPDRHLAPYIDAYYTLETGPLHLPTTRRIFADGCSEIFINLGESKPVVNSITVLKPGNIYFGGTMTASNVVNSMPDSRFLGIRFKPSGFSAFYDLPLDKVVDEIVEFPDKELYSLAEIDDRVATRLDRFFLQRFVRRKYETITPITQSIEITQGLISVKEIAYQPTSPTEKFTKEGCHKELRGFRHKLFELQNVFYADGRFSLLIILQVMDTAGKDGIIRHVLADMNLMGIQVKSFKVPKVEELSHDFLWRIFPHFSAKGMMEVFNRSYYEDIVVPFVGKKLTNEKLHERCEMINALEKHLEDGGTHILKFFLNVSHEEQKGRIKERLDQPDKRWKYSRADSVAADEYKDYLEGYDKVINECSANEWHIMPADQKWYRNYAVAKVLTDYLESLPLKFPGAKKLSEKASTIAP